MTRVHPVAISSLPTQAPPAADRPARVRAFYSATTEEFARWTPSRLFRETFAASVVGEVQRRLMGAGRVGVLEIGCGHGTWAAELFRSVSQPARIDYVGIDFSGPRVDLAQKLFADQPSARFIEADAETFAPDAPADLVLFIEVVSHIDFDRYPNWMRRARGWLNPGGTVVVIDKERFTWHNLRLKWDGFARRWIPGCRKRNTYYFPPHFGELARTLDYPSFAALKRAARRAGLHPRPLLRRGFFRALVADNPAGPA